MLPSNYEEIFRETLKNALDDYHPGWDVRSYWEGHNPINKYLSDSLNRWVDGTTFPRKRGFADFLREAKFPKEVEQSLREIYGKASRQKRQKEAPASTINENNLESLPQQPDAIITSHAATPLDQQADEIQPENSLRQSVPKLSNNRGRLIRIFITLLILLGIGGFIMPAFYRSQSTNSETSQTPAQSPQVTRYPNGWCKAIAVTVGLVSANSPSESQKPKLFFDAEAKVEDFDQSEFFIYFLNDGIAQKEYITANHVNLVGFNIERNQWEFDIVNMDWINTHPNWQTASLWHVDYRC